MLLVDKPTGVTSHDVVEVVRRRLATRRIGHTGTLDPMAQGLLMLLIGSATKCQQALQGHDKAYEAVGNEVAFKQTLGKTYGFMFRVGL